ncbi:hypothetical protein BX666DRAFT_1878671 [Dichotomocladium elegans]|nr:hypothetical protein BX666DRAFT_1878671 [Dichotomocladium elegans]
MYVLRSSPQINLAEGHKEKKISDTLNTEPDRKFYDPDAPYETTRFVDLLRCIPTRGLWTDMPLLWEYCGSIYFKHAHDLRCLCGFGALHLRTRVLISKTIVPGYFTIWIMPGVITFSTATIAFVRLKR